MTGTPILRAIRARPRVELLLGKHHEARERNEEKQGNEAISFLAHDQRQRQHNQQPTTNNSGESPLDDDAELPNHELREYWRHANVELLEDYQLSRLNRVLSEVLKVDGFYRKKLGTHALQLSSINELRTLPCLNKSEIDIGDGSPARFHTYSSVCYSRFHRTSGTRGRPMPVMDTTNDWEWWIETWQYVLDAGQVTDTDIAFMAFSFGPFIGFWSANDALIRRGAMVVPGGGLSTLARIDLVLQTKATILCCTPTYALHMAERAAAEQIDLRSSAVRLLIVAGEPGGSIPEVRARIENAWGARVLDHSGATEVGPWGYGNASGDGLYVIEPEFIAETLRPGTDQCASDGEIAELVLTGLGRLGAPAIRYRTGDLVHAERRADSGCHFLFLRGGILGRADDMIVIRGVNIFPASIEKIVRQFPELGEFRLVADRHGALDELQVIVESPSEESTRALRMAFEQLLGLRIPVDPVEMGVLPRFEGKAKRLEDRRRERSE